MIATEPKVLLLASIDNDEEASNVQNALGGYAILARVRTITEMKSLLQQEEYDAVLCTWRFYESDWDGSLKEVRDSYPDVPIIVLSPSGRYLEWNEVLEAGAFDLLVLPCPRRLALAVTEQAMASYEARKERKRIAPLISPAS